MRVKITNFLLLHTRNFLLQYSKSGRSYEEDENGVSAGLGSFSDGVRGGVSSEMFSGTT